MRQLKRIKISSKKPILKGKRRKSTSLNKTLTTILSASKKPFLRKKPLKKNIISTRQLDKLIDTLILLTVQLVDNVGDVPFAENSATTQVSKFFYTSDAFFDTLDDYQLYENISKMYPGLHASVIDEQVKRKTIIDMLEDSSNMAKILDSYNMNVQDFFRFLFRLCPSVFKGLFVKKVLKSLRGKEYVKHLLTKPYRFLRLKRPSKRSSIF